MITKERSFEIEWDRFVSSLIESPIFNHRQALNSAVRNYLFLPNAKDIVIAEVEGKQIEIKMRFAKNNAGKVSVHLVSMRCLEVQVRPDFFINLTPQKQ